MFPCFVPHARLMFLFPLLPVPVLRPAPAPASFPACPPTLPDLLTCSIETKELKLRPATDVHDYQVGCRVGGRQWVGGWGGEKEGGRA